MGMVQSQQALSGTEGGGLECADWGGEGRGVWSLDACI